MLWAMYFLNYLDRAAIAQARLNKLEQNLHLVGSQYNVCISILFVGYTLVQIPSNMAMATKRVRPSLWMCSWMMAWAVLSACTALAKDYTGLVVTRFLLGIAEAPFYPGAIYLLSLFYTRREIATRIGFLYSANICAISFSGLIAAATFATLDGAHGLHGWQYLFIIEGCLTFGIAFFAMFLLPDHPLTTRWLTPAQRELAQARMDRDTVGLVASKGSIAGLKQLQLVLPDGGQLPRFQQHDHIGPHLPTVLGRGSDCHPVRNVIRQVQRAYHTHHYCMCRRRSGICHILRHAQRRCSLHQLLPFHHRGIRL
jgi:MFS family permease